MSRSAKPKRSYVAGLLEDWQKKQALLNTKHEYTQADIEVGRARERQLIAEAEREAAKLKGDNHT